MDGLQKNQYGNWHEHGPHFQVAGRLEPAKVVEREENKYDQQAPGHPVWPAKIGHSRLMFQGVLGWFFHAVFLCFLLNFRCFGLNFGEFLYIFSGKNKK